MPTRNPVPRRAVIAPGRARAWAALLLCCGLACSGSARAAEGADPANDPALAAARQAYDREDYDTAYPAYRRAAEAGTPAPDVAYRLGMMDRFGWGTERDLRSAARWLKQAAERGHAEAQSELGRMLRDGRGIPQDDRQARNWLQKAAQAGVGVAQLNLGRLYRSGGTGVDADPVEAYAWLTAAASNGYMDALTARAEVARAMSEAQVKEAERRAAPFATRSRPADNRNEETKR